MRSRRSAQRAGVACQWMLLLAAGALPGLPAVADPGDDSRQLRTASSPAWLAAVGRLQVPGSKFSDGRRRHHREDCSATLVARRPGDRSDTIITAWHCLEFYHDLSKPIRFLLPGETMTGPGREAYRVADGGGMRADWAILRLHSAVPRQLAQAVLVDADPADPQRPISMAGYSRDEGLGAGGERLTVDLDCSITRQQSHSGESDCWAYKGASGGAVVQLSKDGVPVLRGVISQGNGAGFSSYVPTGHFRSAVRQHIR